VLEAAVLPGSVARCHDPRDACSVLRSSLSAAQPAPADNSTGLSHRHQHVRSSCHSMAWHTAVMCAATARQQLSKSLAGSTAADINHGISSSGMTAGGALSGGGALCPRQLPAPPLASFQPRYLVLLVAAAAVSVFRSQLSAVGSCAGSPSWQQSAAVGSCAALSQCSGRSCQQSAAVQQLAAVGSSWQLCSTVSVFRSQLSAGDFRRGLRAKAGPEQPPLNAFQGILQPHQAGRCRTCVCVVLCCVVSSSQCCSPASSLPFQHLLARLVFPAGLIDRTGSALPWKEWSRLGAWLAGCSACSSTGQEGRQQAGRQGLWQARTEAGEQHEAGRGRAMATAQQQQGVLVNTRRGGEGRSCCCA